MKSGAMRIREQWLSSATGVGDLFRSWKRRGM
jgi:hypothetical protein